MTEKQTAPTDFIRVSHLTVLDVDKTLINTRKIQRVLEAEAELHGVDTDAMRLRREQTEMFDTVKDLREHGNVSEAQLEDIRESFISAIGKIGVESFLFQGARDYLDTLESRQDPFLLLTTGGGEWQPWKLTATDLIRYPHHVTSGRHKSLLLAHSFDPMTGLYEFGEVESLDGADGYGFADYSITDDNVLAMVGLPRDARGYLMAHGEAEHHRNLRRRLPPNVIPVFGFDHLNEETKAA